MTEAGKRWHGPAGQELPLLPDPADETALTLARAWSRLPSPAVVTLKRVGEIRLQPEQIAMVGEPDGGLAENLAWFTLARASEQAWLGVTLSVCHGLIRAVVGGASPLLIRPLGPAEKGLVAAIVASALRSLGLAHRVTLALAEGPPRWQGQRVLLTGTLSGSEVDGRACFLGPLSWLADGWCRGLAPSPTEPAAVEGVLVVGRTAVPAAELAAAAPGDAVAFVDTPGLLPGVPWPVMLLVGQSGVSARFDPDNNLTLEGSWGESSAVSQDESARWRPAEQRSAEVPDQADASVEVIAELGRISLRANELAELSKGGTLGLGPRPCAEVALLAGGQFWATGELILLGEELGVRIVRLHGQGRRQEGTP